MRDGEVVAMAVKQNVFDPLHVQEERILEGHTRGKCWLVGQTPGIPVGRCRSRCCPMGLCRGKSCHYKLRASPAKATMELPFARNYPVSTSELLLSPRHHVR
jgi:hypothetical protein